MATDAKYNFSLRLTGEKFSPDQLKLGELSDYLKQVEKLYREAVRAEFPSQTEEEIKLSLVQLKPGSLHLTFEPELKEHGLAVYKKVARAINENRFDEFTTPGLEALRFMANFSNRHQVTTEFRNGNARSKPMAVLTPGMNIEPFPRFNGETTIYGKVLRIGGKSPKVALELDGATLTCEVDSESLAIELAARLYQEVGLVGLARWSAKDGKLEEFKVTGITYYEAGSYVEALNQLSKLVGKYFDDIDDVEAYIEELRSD